MKRSLKTALAAMALALAIPGSALANHASHHASSHARHHRHHAHIVRFMAGSVTARKTTTATHSTASTTTTTTTTEMPGETVGTVLSFEAGVLKITLGDGSVVAGKVTEATRLECASAQGQEGSEDGGDQNDQNDPGDDQNEHGGQPPVSGSHDQQGPGSSHGDDEHGSMMETVEPECTVAALVPGAKVEEAELTLTSAGAVWEKVSLTQ
jgi:hypothetical protein